MRYKTLTAAFAASISLSFIGAASAADLEVTHWWTSGGESAAVAEFAKAFDATGNHWVDGAIAGGGNTARPVMISRITGGDPMGATQFNTGRQAEELVAAGLMRDLTDLATKEKWAEVIRPKSLLDGCTVDGKVYCVVVNIHSWQWLWLSNKAFADAGVPVPKNWDEFVAAAPALEKAGKIPLAIGGQPWQTTGAFNVLIPAIAGKDIFLKVYKDKDETVAAGPEIAKVFKAADDARKMSAKSNVQDWNQATNLVITGQAGGQIMGDWAQGEFQVAGQVAGKDYTCLPGLGVNELISTGGDSFYFPKLNDPEKTKAQEVLASTMLSPADAGRLQPEEGFGAGARRRRPRSRQRLHEEGPRHPRQGQHHPRHQPAHDRGHEQSAQRSVRRVLEDAVDDAGRSAEALRRDHRGC